MLLKLLNDFPDVEPLKVISLSAFLVKKVISLSTFLVKKI
jgi:hypothetical protein